MDDNCNCYEEEVDGVPGVPITDLPPQSSACVYLRVEQDGTVTVEVDN